MFTDCHSARRQPNSPGIEFYAPGKKMRIAVEAAIILNARGVIMEVRSKSRKLFDYPVRALIGRKIGLLVPDLIPVFFSHAKGSRVRDAMRREFQAPIKIRAISKLGAARWVNVLLERGRGPGAFSFRLSLLETEAGQLMTFPEGSSGAVGSGGVRTGNDCHAGMAYMNEIIQSLTAAMNFIHAARSAVGSDRPAAARISDCLLERAMSELEFTGTMGKTYMRDLIRSERKLEPAKRCGRIATIPAAVLSRGSRSL